MRRNLSYYCLLAPRIYIAFLRAHPVRGESHYQRNATGEVATVAIHGFVGCYVDDHRTEMESLFWRGDTERHAPRHP